MMFSLQISKSRLVCGVIIVALLNGCALVGPDYEAPDLQAFHNDSWSQTNEADSPLQQVETTVAERWWEQFNDPELNRLVDLLHNNNLSLAAARELIVERRARRGIQEADLLPSAYLGGYGLRIRSADEAASLVGGPPGSQQTLWAGAALAGWEIDLWGRVRRLVEGANQDILAAGEEYGGAKISLTAELITAYVTYRALENRIALIEELLELQNEGIQLAEIRYQSGTGNIQDVLERKNLISTSRANLHQLQQAKAIEEHQIATLCGIPAGKHFITDGKQLATPDVIGVTVPAKLLSRRPDVRQAEHQYAASVAAIGAAEGERFPRIVLGGMLSFQTSQFDKLLHAESLVYAFGSGIILPVFTGGKIDANIRVANSQSEQAKLTLQQTVLNAVNEVEDRASGVIQSRQQLESLAISNEKLSAIVSKTDGLYDSGLATKDSVLEAQVNYLSSRDALETGRQQELIEVIGLYRAMGGGWVAPAEQDATITVSKTNE